MICNEFTKINNEVIWMINDLILRSSNKVRLKNNFVEFSLKCWRRWARLKTCSCWINYSEFATTYRKHVSLYPTLSFFNAWSKLQVCFDNRHTYLIKTHLVKKLNSVLHFFSFWLSPPYLYHHKCMDYKAAPVTVCIILSLYRKYASFNFNIIMPFFVYNYFSRSNNQYIPPCNYTLHPLSFLH